jgi:hypothetical protein
MSNMMLMIMRRLALGYTVHGFRSAFRDWASERCAAARQLAQQIDLSRRLGDREQGFSPAFSQSRQHKNDGHNKGGRASARAICAAADRGGGLTVSKKRTTALKDVALERFRRPPDLLVCSCRTTACRYVLK